MATGDQNDILTRVKSLLPNRWFEGDAPILDALLNGVASGLAGVYALIQYAKAQTRIATATDGFLDLISQDFFGGTLPRRANEFDGPFRARILANLLPEKGTRNGMIKALVALTGRTPVIFEPARPKDTGGWNIPTTGWSSAVGGWGSLRLPHQCFIKAFRPSSSGIPDVIGWGGSAGAWSTGGRVKWSALSDIQGAVTDADIYALIDAMKQAGTTVWVNISN